MARTKKTAVRKRAANFQTTTTGFNVVGSGNGAGAHRAKIKRKELKDERKEMERRHESELKELRIKQGRELGRLVQLQLVELAAYRSSDDNSTTTVECVTCGAEVSDYFVCARCNQSHCVIHGDDNACRACEKTYCEQCLDDLPSCQTCILTDELVCCDLQQACTKPSDEPMGGKAVRHQL